MGKRKKHLRDDAYCCTCCCCLLFAITYFLYLYIISIFPEYEITLNSRNHNDNSNSLFKDNHFIFVGGLHQSGTSVTERLLSSQPFASGLRSDIVDVVNRSACVRPDFHNKFRCIAPENEGIFLTKEFNKYYQDTKRSCSIRGHEDYGYCAIIHHMTENDIRKLGHQGCNQFRANLFSDWGKFWNTSKPLLVEKDISNLIKSRFLQKLFGEKKTGFVFLLRHPMADCKDFRCDVNLHFYAWLRAIKTMEEDLEYLKNYVVIHQEGYIFNVSSITSALKQQFGLPYLNYLDESVPLTVENGLVDLYKHQILKNKFDAYGRIPSRKLIYHTNETTDVQDYTVVIRQIQTTVEWISSYKQKLEHRSNWKTKEILLSIAHHLEKYCYSYDSLIPSCKPDNNNENIVPKYTYEDVYNSSGYSYIWKSSNTRWNNLFT